MTASLDRPASDYRGTEEVTIMMEGDGAPLCQAPFGHALAHEMRVARELLEELAGVLVSDERFVADYLDQLQAFDLIAQHVDESAALLERVAAGQPLPDALGQVRLNVMQARLRAALD
ncbi:hypothetical protein EDF56_10565 [Novosphingobium sp. PhB165]|uniref:hypothetical protein n=1 Tax=Novosphingobium sp. PhB165 TaxID=2485105 RepID=UPI0010EF1AD3|nr:hypothetical protein [Novosphingobium sp. PhB165]TCM17723.1 hypothetical protein EDF56_10565 [Novosphingobium sp. PhB165]